MKDITLVLDIDGVLADWVGWSHPRFCELLDVDLPFSCLNHYDPAKSYGVTCEEFEAARNHLECSLDTARILPTVCGAIDALAKLSSIFCIVFATARHEALHEPTRDWLAEQVEAVIGPVDVFFTGAIGNPYAIQLPSISKLDICHQLHAVALVEDNPHEIAAFVGSDVEPVCIAWPWNACLTDTHPHIMRGDWPTVAAYLLDKYGAAR